MDRLLKRLMVLGLLIERNEWKLRELAWETGLSMDEVRETLGYLSKHYVLTVTDNSVEWSPVDIPGYLRPWGWRLTHKAVLGTTQTAARGKGPWSIVVAEYLVSARGRHGKTWRTDLGGLWLTIVPRVSIDDLPYVPIAAPLVIARSIKSLYGIETKLRWPNDVMIEGKKVAGVLVEAEAFPSHAHVYVGIGINVNNKPPLKEAVSLHKYVGKQPRNRLLATIIGWFSRLHKLMEDKDKLQEQYRALLDTIGREVVLETTAGSVEGTAIDIDRSGALVVREKGGGEKKYSPGDVYKLRYKEED